MQYRSVTYTSLAALDLSEEQLRELHQSAQTLNGIDGISGMLIFNGTHFLQIVEGPPAAIGELLERLERDPRHVGLEIRDDRMIDQRLFGDWSMKMVRVRTSFMMAQEDVALQLPSALPEHVRDRILSMVEQISEEVEL